jgi:hypothetical protein
MSQFITFVYWALLDKFDMVWLYRSPIPVGRRGYLLVQMISTCLRYAEGGGGDQHPVVHGTHWGVYTQKRRGGGSEGEIRIEKKRVEENKLKVNKE